MILRSQLRMSKNIVLPLVCCIMVIITLLVLVHKSSDELHNTKKELGLCKQEQITVSSQLHNAVEQKLHFEKSLESEKEDGKQKMEDLQDLLNKEKEKAEQIKQEAETKYYELNQQWDVLKAENKKCSEVLELNNKKVLELEGEISKLNTTVANTLTESIRKDAIIAELKAQMNKSNIIPDSMKKSTPTNSAQGPVNQINLVPVQSSSKGPSTPEINPAAINKDDDSPKQVAPPPNEDDTNRQNNLKKSGDVDNEMEPKNEENDLDAFPLEDKVGDVQPLVPQLEVQKKAEKSSSASNIVDGNREVLQPPLQNPKNEKEIGDEPAKGENGEEKADEYENEDDGEVEFNDDGGKVVKNKKVLPGNEVFK